MLAATTLGRLQARLVGRWRGVIIALSTCAFSFPSLAQECRTQAEARPKVVGGQSAQLRYWPGQAVLRLHAASDNASHYFCGGTAVGGKWVLTAAHCVDEYRTNLASTFSNEPGKILTGSLEVVIGVDDLDAVREENIFKVEKVVVREGYKGALGGNDVALIALNRPYIGPVLRVSLQAETDPKTPPGALVRVAGFGSLKAGSKLNFYRADAHRYSAGSRRLLETAIPTVAREVCRAHYAPKGAEVLDGQLCAGLEEGGRDSCQGDSGGPLLAYDRAGCPFQIGVVSWGAECAGASDYGVYTAVSYHAAWITQHTGSLAAVSAGDVDMAVAEVVSREFTQQALGQLADALPAAKGGVRVSVKGGERIRVGEEVVFVVQSEVPGRLIVVDINAAGEVVQILPNRYTPAHSAARISAGAAITVPSAGYGFTGFRAVEPLGKGSLLALVVPDAFPMEALAARKEQLARGFAPVNTPTNYLMNLVQQVVGTATGRSGISPRQQEWALGIESYEIVN